MNNKKTNIQNEHCITCSLRQWFDLQYPTIIMRCSMSGVRLPIGLAKKMKQLNPARAYPDIFLPEPRGKYHGLYIELKRCRADLYTKSGAYRKTQHIDEQTEVLKMLREKGYKAVFACGFEEAQFIISDYLDRRMG